VWSNDAKLPQEIPTIPEAFRDAGYRTVGVSQNGQFSPATGLDRGFDDFHYLIKSTLLPESGIGPFLKWILNLRRHSGGATLDGNQHCIDYLSTRIAKQHIETATDDDDPLFLYIHYGDTHHAYTPPVAWRDRFSDDLPMPPDEAIDFALDMSDRSYEYIATDDPFTDEEWETLRTLYDTCIAYVDHLTGELVAHARRHLDDPIIIGTADHGELFGERGLLAHMLVTNTAVSNVPLVVTGLDGLPDEGFVQHADVMQMLCGDLDIDHPVPIGQDIRKEPRQYAVVQRGSDRARNKLEKVGEYSDEFSEKRFHLGDLTALRTEKWRYQRSSNESRLFKLPDETTDVSQDYPSVAAELDELCQNWLNDVGQPVGRVGTAEFSDETRTQLRELGYLQ
jgi:uncharacterized sulfatase